jgi:hypothetical protein
MQITVEIPDELVAKVQARGLTPESYVRGLIDGAERSDPKPLRLREPRMSMKEFLEAMAANSDKMPVLPDEAFTRESFYQDHDWFASEQPINTVSAIVLESCGRHTSGWAETCLAGRGLRRLRWRRRRCG